MKKIKHGIPIWNRKELIVTMDLNRQAEIRGILSANQINYVIKTTNLQNAQLVGIHRGRMGNLGINQAYSYEYRIFVHKKDYDKAVKLME